MRVLTLAASLGLLAAPALAQTYDSDRGTVSFTSRVPLHTFTGTSPHLSGELDVAARTVDFYVDLGTLETGIGRRDRDMREALDTDRFPFAEFTGRLATAPDLSRSGPQPTRVRGRFSLHGVTRTVDVAGTLEHTRQGLRVRASWKIRLGDYRIEPPRLLGVKVDEVQAIEIDILLARR